MLRSAAVNHPATVWIPTFVGMTVLGAEQLPPLLERHAPEAEVWAFGSRVAGGAHEGSDLDLVLRYPARPAVPVSDMAGLRLALQESMLPFSVDVHDWARVPETFRRNMERCHVVLRAGADSRTLNPGTASTAASA